MTAPHIVVLPSFTEVGIGSKSERGLVSEPAAVPDALKPMQGALSRIASKLGVDLNQSRSALQASFEQALTRRASTSATSSQQGPALNP